jgi:hypothetical protein
MTGKRRLRARRLSDVAVRRMEWLIPDRVPVGTLTLLVGDPGRGKSLLTAEWGAQVTRGDSETGPRDAVFVTAEDSPGATVRPRLEAAGACIERIWMPHDDEGDQSLWLPQDTDALGLLIAERRARLVVIDPLTAHLSSAVNSWQDQSVRTALTPLARLAEKHGCAVVVVAHLRKAPGNQAIHQIGGSIGFPALARSVLVLAQDPVNRDRRILGQIKCNVGKLAPSLSYTVEQVGEQASDGTTVNVPRLRLDGESELTVEELLAPAKDAGPVVEAADFLAGALADGPLPARLIRAEARKAGISNRTLDRAKEMLNVKSHRHGGFGNLGTWRWSLTSSASGPKDAKPSSTNGSGSEALAKRASRAEWRT